MSTLATSVICVSRLGRAAARCTRSPRPVRVGVKTSCPRPRSTRASGVTVQPPRQPPWMMTKVLIGRGRSRQGVVAAVGIGAGIVVEEEGHIVAADDAVVDVLE